MADIVRDDSRPGGYFGRGIHWSAIWGGIIATLGIFVLMMFLGSALGMTIFNPFTGSVDASSISWATLAWTALSILVAFFFGAWVSGYWADLFAGADAFIHGMLTWALSLLLAVLGFSLLAAITSQGMQAGAIAMPGLTQQSKALTYNTLDDQRFIGFVLQRANQYAASQPVMTGTEEGEAGQRNGESATTRSERQADKGKEAGELGVLAPVEADDVEDDSDLINYVVANTNLNRDQAQEFLKSEAENIAQAQNDARKTWARQHHRELVQAQMVHKSAKYLSWAIFGLTLLGLLAALGGSYLGWYQQRDYDEDEDVVVTREPGAPSTGL